MFKLRSRGLEKNFSEVEKNMVLHPSMEVSLGQA